MKRNWTKGLLGLIGALALALPLTMGQTAHADTTPDPATQTVILTKYGFSNAPDATAHQTDQTPAEAKADWAKDGTALPGVKFSVYDVTTNYWSNPDHYTGDMTDAKQVATGTTDSNGQITFKDLHTTSGTHNAVYLFQEDQARTGYDGQSSQDFWISLPAAADKDGNVYVYPKNTQQTTYSHKFLKKDSHTKGALAGAQFQIQDAQTKQFLAITDANGNLKATRTGFVDTLSNNFKLTWVADAAQATTFTTNGDGEFGVNGFTDNTQDRYTAIETQAPAGYEEAANTSFTADDQTTDILDAPRGLLPHTGGTGIIAILAVGAALLALAFVGIKKRQARA